ncbi:hypothetical protein E4U41_007126 [Claviceps citrina]|nr:hypothetical protein E4U41_007126 [Claviceps citrina]
MDFTSIRLRQMLRRPRRPSPPPEPQPSDKTDAETDIEVGDYRPTLMDITVAHMMLTRSLKLPSELADSILDMAEYWAHSVNVIDYLAVQQRHERICGSRGTSSSENKFLLRSYPLGLTGIDGQDSLSQNMVYKTRVANPLPRTADRDPSYFSKLVKYPTPRLLNPARKIVFNIKSRDQGWGGDHDKRGTYKGSWTWFEAGHERFESEAACWSAPLNGSKLSQNTLTTTLPGNAQCALDQGEDETEANETALSVCHLRPLHPKISRKQTVTDDNKPTAEDEDEYAYVHQVHPLPEWQIQCNKTATREWQEHKVTWSYSDDVQPDSDAGRALEDKGRGRATADGSFVRSLRMGDVITVWGKARFPGWENNVEYVKIEVYWAV